MVPPLTPEAWYIKGQTFSKSSFDSEEDTSSDWLMNILVSLFFILSGVQSQGLSGVPPKRGKKERSQNGNFWINAQNWVRQKSNITGSDSSLNSQLKKRSLTWVSFLTWFGTVFTLNSSYWLSFSSIRSRVEFFPISVQSGYRFL